MNELLKIALGSIGNKKYEKQIGVLGEMLADKELLLIAAKTKKANPTLTGDDLLARAKGDVKHAVRKKSGFFGFLTADTLLMYPKVQAYLDATLPGMLGIKP